MGYIGDGRAGLGGAFYLVPACYVVLAGIMIWDGLLGATATDAAAVGECP